jgi:O-antigen/teichoic acid export membrane protein
MNAIEFIKEFFRRQGLWILGANTIIKICGFAAVVFVTRNTSEQDFGSYSYALNIVLAFVPFMGLGSYQAFLRFSTDASGQLAKKDLFHYAYARGILLSMVLVALLYVLAPILCRSIPESVSIFRVLTLVVLTTLNMEFVKSYARAIHMNGISAKIDITYAVSLLVLSILLSSFKGVMGYAAAVAIAPVVAVLYHGWRMNIAGLKWVRLNTSFRLFWKYGIFTTIGALFAQMFYAVDVFMIGQIVGEKATSVALYRVAVIIPIATLVVPISISATDFVKNSANKYNPSALKSYVINYWRTFGWISLGILSILWLLAPWILGVFGHSYRAGAEVMRIFLIGILGAHLLRVPFGNLLSAVGKANWNTYINTIVLVLTVLFCKWIIPEYGIRGAAFVMTSMMWVSGVMNGLGFWFYCIGCKS